MDISLLEHKKEINYFVGRPKKLINDKNVEKKPSFFVQMLLCCSIYVGLSIASFHEHNNYKNILHFVLLLSVHMNKINVQTNPSDQDSLFCLIIKIMKEEKILKEAEFVCVCVCIQIYILIYILCASYLNLEHGAIKAQTQISHLLELSIKNTVQYKKCHR